jgi:ABC-type Fe3+/spermidine/putrescine transport system ATPase subunit
MAEVSLQALTRRFGGVGGVAGVSLEIGSGEFVSLVGPSGCGKTTLLRLIAGFDRADSGSLAINGKRVDGLAPHERKVGFVFQSYALFPTKTVAENIAFSLRLRRSPRAEIGRRVAELCALMRLDGLAERYPHELSGGQQQRVALARALAPEPAILLLDEPLSALDAKIRAHLRTEIRAVADRLGVTTVYVTHDQEEALSISDRVAVMDGGCIRQVGAPMEVYLRPADPVVATFIGASNLLAGRARADGGLEVDGVDAGVPHPDGAGGGEVTVCLRPEQLMLHREDVAAGGGCVVERSSFLGPSVRAWLATARGQKLVVDVPAGEWLACGLAAGQTVGWSAQPGRAVVFPASAA